MIIKKELALSFDDVLLVPRYNTIPSRQDPLISTQVKVSKSLTLAIPVMSSPMDTVTEGPMAIALARLGGLGIVHRYNTIEKQVAIAKEVKDAGCRAGFAIGATGDYLERAAALLVAGVDIYCVDVAHGDSKIVYEAVAKLRSTFPNCTIIAGNVATGYAAYKLAKAGADAIRVGIGGGSLCTTRRVTGNGMPTLESLIDCHENFGLRDVCIIADGGIRNSGDAVKALAAGANCVMLGQMLAGTDESPGELKYETKITMFDWGPKESKTGKIHKVYRGMSSFDAQQERNPHSSRPIVPEGDKTLVPYKGTVDDVIYQLMGGIRSGMTYQGASSFRELYDNSEFVQITHAGLAESHPHAKKE